MFRLCVFNSNIKSSISSHKAFFTVVCTVETRFRLQLISAENGIGKCVKKTSPTLENDVKFIVKGTFCKWFLYVFILNFFTSQWLLLKVILHMLSRVLAIQYFYLLSQGMMILYLTKLWGTEVNMNLLLNCQLIVAKRV